MTLPLANAAEGKGLSKLWARRKIADAEVARTMRSADAGGGRQGDPRARARASAGDPAHEPGRGRHDAEPARRASRSSRAELPLNLPAGWDFDKVFGERRQPASRRERRAGCGRRARPGCARQAQPARLAAPGVMLPKTATDAELKMIAGAVLLALGLVLLVFDRRRVRGLTPVTGPSSPRLPPSARGLRQRGARAGPRAQFPDDDDWLRGCVQCLAANLPPPAAPGLALFGQGVYVRAKALARADLLEPAFAATIATGRDEKPWSWADAWRPPASRCGGSARARSCSRGSSGQALGVGPGHVERDAEPGEHGIAAYSAHRDTHYRFSRTWRSATRSR